MNTQRITRLALFTTIALAIYAAESLLPPLFMIPGMKLGLSNIITLVMLKNYSATDTLLVIFMRILLATFFFGQFVSFLYSLTGGILCFFVMLFIHKLLHGHLLFLTSISGGIAHNLGQILIAFLLTKVSVVFSYLPFLIISGVLTGLFTGLCAHFAQKYLLPVIRRNQS
ncbi:Gx transporter family protein [Lachnospiraceae bacterium OttesenSCG-928-D06]|nr:Gx transporter family protein [Lachnospiraceae bacterium OttesenSCG-928-D06]